MKNIGFNMLALGTLAIILFISGCGGSKTLESSARTITTTTVSTTVSTTMSQASVIKPATTITDPAGITAVPLPTATQWPAVTVTQLGDPPDTTYTVRILLADGNLDPKVVTIPVGTKVIWWTTEHWVDQTLKTDDGVVLGTPFLFKALEYFFTTPGTYNYYDDFSPWVKGTIIVY